MGEKERVRILLVDDQPSNLVVMQAVLAPLDETLISVTSGEEALRAVLQYDFAAILLDVHMPTLSGFDTARMIRGRSRSSHVPILFITASIDSDFPLEDAYILGAVDYLSKPILPAVLRAKVAFFVDLYRKNEELASIERARHTATLNKKDKKIRLGEQRFSLLVNSSGEGLFGLGMDASCTFLNPAAASMLGYRPEELTGRPIHDIIFARVSDGVPDAGDEVSFADAIRCGVPKRVHEELFCRKDGSRFPVSYSISPMTVDGQVEGAVVTFTDITQRKRTEDELRRVAAEMSEADRLRNEFLATLAHELRNPLAPLRNGLEVMRLAINDPAKLTHTSEVMERQLSIMVHLVNDLLDVARITNGSVNLKKKIVALSNVINSAVETSSSLISAGGHTLITEAPPEPVYAEIDPTRIAQAVSNLLNNAAKYTPAGGIIRLSTKWIGNELQISVTDSGIGIPAESIESVFTMFAQLKHGAQLAQGGLGIGLSLVKRLIELHDGTVKVSSAGIGKGSTFVICLPLDKESADRYASISSPLAIGNGVDTNEHTFFKIAVVDDNIDAANTLSSMLEILGHEVCVAHNGRQALRLVSDFRPDVAFLDIGMPDMNGYETAIELRKMTGARGLTLVAVTGWGAEADRARAMQAGFDQHLTKPASMSSVKAVLLGLANRRNA